MNNYDEELKVLQASVPENYSEENLQRIEKMVTNYHHIMQSVAEDDKENETQYHLERMGALESYLRNAKYGTSERQRAASFGNARETLLEGIQALINIVNRSDGKEDPRE